MQKNDEHEFQQPVSLSRTAPAMCIHFYYPQNQSHYLSHSILSSDLLCSMIIYLNYVQHICDSSLDIYVGIVSNAHSCAVYILKRIFLIWILPLIYVKEFCRCSNVWLWCTWIIIWNVDHTNCKTMQVVISPWSL